MKTRLLILIAFCMMAVMIPCFASAEDHYYKIEFYPENGFTYTRGAVQQAFRDYLGQTDIYSQQTGGTFYTDFTTDKELKIKDLIGKDSILSKLYSYDIEVNAAIVGFGLKENLSDYPNEAALNAERESEELIPENQTVRCYAIEGEMIQSVMVDLANPSCGTEIENKDGMYYPKPEVTVPKDAHFTVRLDEGTSSWYFKDDRDNPITGGKFLGYQEYAAKFTLVPDFGYKFHKDIPNDSDRLMINIREAVYSDFDADGNLVVYGLAEAGHVFEEVITRKATLEQDGQMSVKCSACGQDGYVDSIIPHPDNISLKESNYRYDGEAKEPAVIVKAGDSVISEKEYTVAYDYNVNVGQGKATITFTGVKYEGTMDLTFTIDKGKNPLSVKPKTATVKYSKLKKKAQSLKVSKVVKVVNSGAGKRTYKLSSAKKGTKSFKKYFKVASNGNVTVKKGLKKGTYKVKVYVTAAGDASYNKIKKPVTFKVAVK